MHVSELLLLEGVKMRKLEKGTGAAGGEKMSRSDWRTRIA